MPLYDRDQLRDAMRQRGIGPSALARSTGYSRGYVAMVLGGQRDVSAAFAARAAQALDLPATALEAPAPPGSPRLARTLFRLARGWRVA